MKLNNRGWGLAMMLVFLGILSIFILVTWINSYKIADSYDDLKDDLNSSAKVPIKYYHDLENRLSNAAKSFLTNNPSELCDMYGCTIEYDGLRENNYISEMIDRYDNSECDGYVKVEKGNYHSFVNCENYRTAGY